MPEVRGTISRETLFCCWDVYYTLLYWETMNCYNPLGNCPNAEHLPCSKINITCFGYCVVGVTRSVPKIVDLSGK